jgi:hypothetical protein
VLAGVHGCPGPAHTFSIIFESARQWLNLDLAASAINQAEKTKVTLPCRSSLKGRALDLASADNLREALHKVDLEQFLGLRLETEAKLIKNSMPCDGNKG